MFGWLSKLFQEKIVTPENAKKILEENLHKIDAERIRRRKIDITIINEKIKNAMNNIHSQA